MPAAQGTIRRGPDGDKVAYVQFHTFSEGAHGELRDEIERLYRRGPRGWCSTCAATAAGCSTRRCSAPASSSRTATWSRPAAAPRATATTRRPATRSTRGRPSCSSTATPPRRPRSWPRRCSRTTSPRSSAPAPTARGPSRSCSTCPTAGRLDLTIGEYLTADGTSILGKGVKPDVRIADDPRARRCRRRAARAGARRCSASEIAAAQPMRRQVAVVGRRGRFLVAEPLFERGAEQVGIAGGVRVRGGEMVRDRAPRRPRERGRRDRRPRGRPRRRRGADLGARRRARLRRATRRRGDATRSPPPSGSSPSGAT